MLFAITLLFAIGWLAFAPRAAPCAEHLVRIGVLETTANRGAASRWAPTAAYLKRNVPGYDFAVFALNPDEIRHHLDNDHLEFVLTDAGLFVDLNDTYALTAVATRRVRQHDRVYPYSGAVILARANRADLTELSDLRGKSFMSLHANFGSFHLAWLELDKLAIRPFRDFSRVILESTSAERVLYALRDGQVDAAAVPTGTLERLSAEGRIDPRLFRVLNARPATGEFPLARSTPLYPEWPLAATPVASHLLVQAVAQGLYAMAPEDPAAQAGGYAGWSVPTSYQSVHALYQDLRLGQYQPIPLLTLAREHWPVMALSLVALLALAAVALRMLHMNRKLAEEIRRGKRAREQIQMFASAVEQAADAVMITDPNGVIEYVNPAFTRLTGYGPEEVRGKTPALLKSGHHDALFYRRLWDTISRGEVFNEELVSRRKDGTLYWEQKSITPLRDATGNIAHYIATGRDVTEQRRTEEEAQLRREQLAHTARVNVIGEMAASVAHEISQPLTAIINYAQGSVRRMRAADIDGHRLLSVFEQITAQAQRAADAILTLRRFVARHRPQRVQADINSLVKQVVALAAGETRKRGIAIELELSESLPPVSVDDVQIEQVILNLLRNGAEALASAETAARELKVRTALADDGSVEISISDTGPGLPPRLAAKLFEPFFTTKPDGVGLGLAISRSIIETHGGRIWVTPNTDRGVTFRFTVPVETQTHER
jgi:two-component system sensor histidine kinase TtrS